MKRFFSSIKESILEKKIILLILGGVIGLLSYFIVYMVEDMDLSAIEDIIKAWPEGMIEFFGDATIFTNPYGFWSLELMTFIWIYAGIYIIFMASGLLSQDVEDKTIDLTLSKPISRYNFLGSKIAFLYVFIMATIGIVFLITMGSMAGSSVYQVGTGSILWDLYYFDRLWVTYISVVLFLAALAMVAIFFSTIFLNTRKSMAFGVIVLFVMFFLGEFYIYMDEAVQNIKYFSIFHYFNPADYIVHGDFTLFTRDIIVLGIINASLIGASLFVFDRKDIPI